MLDDGLGPWLRFEHTVFVLKKLFPFPLATAELIGDYFHNRRRNWQICSS
jgi:hypothetical protein